MLIAVVTLIVLSKSWMSGTPIKKLTAQTISVKVSELRHDALT